MALKLGFSKTLRIKYKASTEEGGGVYDLDIEYRDPSASEWVAYNSAVARLAVNAAASVDPETKKLSLRDSIEPGQELLAMQTKIGAELIENVVAVDADIEVPEGSTVTEIVRTHLPFVCVAVAQAALDAARMEGAASAGKSESNSDPSSGDESAPLSDPIASG